MIGIWGPSGIGKTTIARVAYNKLSTSFQLSVFMESIEANYSRPCSDDYSAKLHLQQLFMSQITNQNDIKISHLGVVNDRLKDKKVLVVLDGVDQSVQLDAMAKETWWFGPGSRIIITTQNRKLFRTHGINHIYKASRKFIGINFDFSTKNVKEKFNISERAFQGMTNLRFLKFQGGNNTVDLPCGLEYMSQNLRLLQWSYFPMTCLPPIFNSEFLVEIKLSYSKLEKLWEGIKPLPNLKWMDLSSSKNLKELPDLSTATNLLELDLGDCSSLVKLPSTIGYTKNLQQLDLCGCSSLISLPSFIGTSTNLQILNLGVCSSLGELPSFDNNFISLSGLDLSRLSSLVELPSFDGNLQKLQYLILNGCSKLEFLPTDINLESLYELDLTNCFLLKFFPEISTSLTYLKLKGTAIEEVPSSIKSWSRFTYLSMTYSVKLKECPHAFHVIKELHVDDKEIQELPPWVNEFSRLELLMLNRCKKLVSIPQIPDSLTYIVAEDCESLERLDCSFQNPYISSLNFAKCFKLNQAARDLIIRTRTSEYAVLPGGEVPSYFTHRAARGSLTINLNEKHLPTSMRFKACILLVNENENDTRSNVTVTCKNSRMRLYDNFTEHLYIFEVGMDVTSSIGLFPTLTEHLYIFELEMDVTSSELVFEFKVRQNDWVIGQCNWKIGQCGVIQLSEVP
ncbi:hypothetical protein CARUB_v10025905mg [Capsella rubella]|uniref:ADP-ribosyl cyclase/cyclic ADP-ribose hydrolase n=1 Tax=Capsella rubella TaxID=81985 RepID=R0GKU6_9BRAS|nr:hypothetical protein CARUB_v10025905mg [Capsella rubella]